MKVLYLWTATSYQHTLRRSGARCSYGKANWPKMKEDASTFVRSFLESLSEMSMDENWEKIKGHLTSSMVKHITSRTTSWKKHQPWITHGIWRNGPERSTAYTRKPGRAATPTPCQPFRITSSRWQKEVKKAKVCYVNEHVLGELEDGNTKPFYRYIKIPKDGQHWTATL